MADNNDTFIIERQGKGVINDLTIDKLKKISNNSSESTSGGGGEVGEVTTENPITGNNIDTPIGINSSSSSSRGTMSAFHFNKLEAFNEASNYYLKTDLYNRSEIDGKLFSVFIPKSSVATINDLPTTGNMYGDVREVLSNGKNYVWVKDYNGLGIDGWDDLGGVIDLSSYPTISEYQQWVNQQNYLKGIQVNGVDQLVDPTTKKVNITVDSIVDLSDYSTTDETADIIAQNYYDKSYIDNYIDNVELGVEGRVLTSQTLAQLNALDDGIYIASTAGTYANGFTVPTAHFVKFKKVGTTWTIFQDVEIPAYNDSALQANVTKLRSDLDSFTADSPNLINSVGNFRGGSYNSSGAFLASNNQLSLQPFSILPNTTYTISGTSVSSNTRFVFRDANNTFISALNGNTSSVQTFTTPANASTVSINVATGTNVGTPENRENSIYHDTLMLNIGSSPRPFQYFGRYIKTEKYDIIYVDGTNGNDTNNNGSAFDYPLKTIATAKKFASKKCTLVLSRGDYDYTSDIFYFENVIGKVQHVVRFFGGIKITNATPVSSGSTVLQYSYNFPATWTASTYRLYQLDIPDANEVIADADRMPHHKGRQNYLDHTIMKSVASIQAVEDATKPCYFYDSVNKIFYFKKVSGSDLTINPVLIPTNIVLGNTTVGKKLMWSNLQFLGVPVSFTNVTGTINSVEFGLCNSGGTCKTDNANDLTFNNCVAYGSSNDGFNGAGTVYGTQKFANLTKVTFNNCWAHHCDDDGESHHGYCEVYWNNGLSEKNNTGNSPASGCHAVYTNSYVQNNIGIGFSVAGAALDGGVSTDAVLNGCFSQKNGSNYAGTIWTKTINCVSRLPTSGNGHFSGITQKFNCVELNS